MDAELRKPGTILKQKNPDQQTRVLCKTLNIRCFIKTKRHCERSVAMTIVLSFSTDARIKRPDPA